MTTSAASGAFWVPTGTVAFLLTDVEGSTRHWDRDADAMTAAMARHYVLVDACVSARGGVRPHEQGEGDSVVAAFPRASDALLAARDLQRACMAEVWPTHRRLRLRMAVHAGEARLRDVVSYAGEVIIRAGRLRSIGHGGQVLVSQAARDLAVDSLGDEVELVDLGTHRLKDLARPEQVWQLRAEGLLDDFGPLASLDAVPNNLPSSLSKFIGRTAEMATVLGLLGVDRLVTLTGAGGAGKSRLALHVAAEVIDECPDGVWWVELAPVTAAGAVALTVATAMGFPDPGRNDPLDRLAVLIGTRAALVVLDNAEHLVEQVAELTDRLLSACPRLRILVTSRRPLELAGEVTWRVPSMSCPAERDHPLGLVALEQFDAVNLFVDRARRVRPGFVLSEVNAAHVADICQRVDGLPMAIELAASRCRSLSPAQVRAGLTDAFRILNAGSRTVLPRQQTLEASITWSHDLLSDEERAVLRRLAVFHGGWTLPAAEQVVPDGVLVGELDVLDILDRLVQHSLVQVDDGCDGQSRFRMLETVRQFEVRQLHAAGEFDVVRSRHADGVLAMLRQLGQWAADERVFDIWSILEPELANLDAGIAGLYTRGDHGAVAQSLVDLEGWFTCTRRYALAVRWSAPAVNDPRGLPDALLPAFLLRVAVWRLLQGRWPEGVALLQSATERARERDDQLLLLTIDIVSTMAGIVRLDPATETAARTNLDRARVTGDLTTVRLALYMLIGVYIAAGRPLEAADLFDEFRSSELPAVVRQDALAWEGTNARMLGRISESLTFYTELQQLDARSGSLGHSTALGGHALSAFDAGVPGPDEEDLDEILRRANADEDPTAVALAQIRIGLRATRAADPAGARDAFQAARATMPGTLWATWADAALVPVLDQLDQPDEMQSAIARLRATGQPLRTVLADLGDTALALRNHNHVAAEKAAHDALALASTHGLLAQAAVALEMLADNRSRVGPDRDAARLLGAAHRLRRELGAHGVYPIHMTRRTATVDRLRQDLGDTSYEEAFAEGTTLRWPDAVAYAQRTHGQRKRPSHGWDAITPTEHNIIAAALDGLTNTDIARRLLMGQETVKTHLAHIYTKLAINNRAQLANIAHNRDSPARPSTRPAN